MKRFIRVAMLLCMVTVLLSALSLKTIEAKATPSSGKVFQNQFSYTSCGKWSVVPSPNPNVVPSGLSAVAAVSANDVWAVGSSGNQMSGALTLIEHWNGTSWSVVTSVNPGSIYNTLYGVTAVSTTNVWAVGYYVNTTGVTQTLIEHWNGTSWSVVTSPSPATGNNELFSVSAVSASSIWAVGFLTNNSSTPIDQTLIEHWNGTSWSVVKSPNPGSSSNHLNGVTAVSTSDVWAVGNGKTSSGKTLIEHWNGTSWSVVASPSPGSGGDFRAVDAVSAGNVWAVGYYLSNSSSILTLVERWNGASWQVVKSANIGTSPTFSAVAAVSANDVWAVGSYHNPNSNEFFQTLTEHWNGTKWSMVKSPSPGSFSTQLLGVAAVSPTNVWAVGYADSNTLTEHFHC